MTLTLEQDGCPNELEIKSSLTQQERMMRRRKSRTMGRRVVARPIYAAAEDNFFVPPRFRS